MRGTHSLAFYKIDMGIQLKCDVDASDSEEDTLMYEDEFFSPNSYAKRIMMRQRRIDGREQEGG